MQLSAADVRLTIGRLIALSYSTNGTLTLRLMREAHGTVLTVDRHGNARLTGIAGVVSFSGTSALDRIGVQIRRIHIVFLNEKNMEVGYAANIDLSLIHLTFAGRFDLEALITACSGLLCKAANLMKGRTEIIDQEIHKAMETR